MQHTGIVTTPPNGFLMRLRDLSRARDRLVEHVHAERRSDSRGAHGDAGVGRSRLYRGSQPVGTIAVRDLAR